MRRSLLLAALCGLAVAGSACATDYPPPAGSFQVGAPMAEPAPRGAQPIVPIPQARDSRPSNAVEARLLVAHNVERERVGTPALIWDDALAAEAGAWARQLLATGRFEHDLSGHGHGENLWTGWGGRVWTPEEMVADWSAEKRDYVRGDFPNVSRTGNWTAVGHYTQMVWRGTTHVGCAIASQGDRSVLACRYSPPGNIDGRRAY
ncbi:CAP domain-containing protein [Brevundimonas sp.]|uniref:CAP domain-containing protein n=1 Tax=Brevundimonas sp. TaxID=1871086 RepID=UPI00272F068C|nr:CAP domain-containing protein [Brevundimonas sp.]MDP1913582.1 CAP domain-containing protein [Brevundimonas sp.]